MQLPIDIYKVKEGDRIAFKSFFEYFYPKLMALACRFVEEHVAKDLVQDVFVSYWEQKKMIEADNIQSFLFKWVQNRCLNYLKHQMVIEAYEARMRIAEARIAFLNDKTDTNDVLKQVVDRDIRELIESSVKKLPSRTAEVFRLCYYHDLPHKEIAKVLDISPRTVETHIRHAVLFLREDLKDLLLLFAAFCQLS
ncbi:MAG: RNA polymerase sigma-70 factor [Parabacteroides gordonii]|uniref:RNA polymerase sigma-70 factor n=1 Tax=Parabacteroides gordonii TaxID=574930 RepID=UPI003A84A68E